MKKSEVYRWRVSQELKMAIEEAAREEGVTVSQFLERAARERIKRSPLVKKGLAWEEEERRIRARAMKSIGAIATDDPTRAERARELIRARLRKRHGAR